MAEEADKDSKTEEPTAKRLRESRNRGDVATSREVTTFVMLIAFALFMATLIVVMGDYLMDVFGRILANVHLYDIEGGGLVAVARDVVVELGFILAIPLSITLAAALFGGLIQNGILFSAESLKPKLSKINPISGLKRLFSLRTVTEFAKSLVKLGLVVGVAAAVIIPEMDDLGTLMQMTTLGMLDHLQDAAVILLIPIVILMLVIALLDFMYQRFEHNKKLRMTKQEVKDEHKQTEGDPMIKSRLRQIRSERARKRMMAAVPKSDVVVTNPTHFAVALKYDPDTMAAPHLVAKGTDLVAKRIRDLADEHDVPIVENPPLARALHAGVELDQEVPPEHYQAVAEIIGYVMRLKNGQTRQTAGA